MPFFIESTLGFSKKLIKAGLEPKIAEELTRALNDCCIQPEKGSGPRKNILSLENKIENLEQKLELLEHRLLAKISALLFIATLSISLVIKTI